MFLIASSLLGFSIWVMVFGMFSSFGDSYFSLEFWMYITSSIKCWIYALSFGSRICCLKWSLSDLVLACPTPTPQLKSNTANSPLAIISRKLKCNLLGEYLLQSEWYTFSVPVWLNFVRKFRATNKLLSVTMLSKALQAGLDCFKKGLQLCSFLVSFLCWDFLKVLNPFHQCQSVMWYSILSHFSFKFSESPSHEVQHHQKRLIIALIHWLREQQFFFLANFTSFFLMFFPTCHTSNWCKMYFRSFLI